MLRKFICFVFILISIAAIVSYTLTLDNWISLLGMTITFDELINSLSSMSPRQFLTLSSTLLYIAFQVYGFPAAILLIGIVGFTIPRK